MELPAAPRPRIWRTSLTLGRMLTIALAVATFVLPLSAQVTTAKNLQVLPQDITQDSLIAIMGGFTRALGVRCSYCHVARNGNRPAPDEFELDELETKGVARSMLLMVRDLNTRYLPGAHRPLDARHAVSCATCHHGLARPRTLVAELLDRYDSTGVDGTIRGYRQLRERYYGTAAYDFSDVSLPTAADRIAAEAAHRQDAILLLRLNLEFNPQSWFTYQQMGQLQLAMGDTAAAIQSLDRGLAIDSTRAFMKQLRESLRRSVPPAIAHPAHRH